MTPRPRSARTAIPLSAASLALRRLLLLLALAGLAVLIFLSFQWSVRDDKGLLDFGSFVASGQAANEGLDPYGVYDLTYRFGPDGVPAPNLNPPISIYPFQLLARFDPEAGYAGWYVVSLACFAAAVLLLYRVYPPANLFTTLLPFGLAGLWHTLELGQIYTPLVLACAGASLWLRDGDDYRAGALLGFVAAIKPQFGLVLLFLLLAGHRKSAIGGAGMGMGLWAVPLALEGPGIYQSWLRATPPVLPANTLPGNGSLLATAGRFDLDQVGILLSVVVVIAAAFVVWRRKATPLDATFLGLATAVLIGPISWPGYALLLLPVLVMRGWQRTGPAMALLFFPYWLVIDLTTGDGAAMAIIGSMYGLAILVLWWSLFVSLAAETGGRRVISRARFQFARRQPTP